MSLVSLRGRSYLPGLAGEPCSPALFPLHSTPHGFQDPIRRDRMEVPGPRRQLSGQRSSPGPAPSLMPWELLVGVSVVRMCEGVS
jgi:hypothetical protein